MTDQTAPGAATGAIAAPRRRAATQQGSMVNASTIVMVLYLAFLLIPIYWLLNMSLKTNAEILGGLTLWPRNFTLQNYVTILTDPAWYMGYVNSLIYVLLNTVISLSVALPADHPLTGREGLDNQDLAEETVLSLSPSYTLHDQIAALCSETGAFLSRDYEGTSLDALRQMVAMGMGLTFLPALYVRSEIEGRAAGDVVTRPFRGRRFSRSVGLVWRKNSGTIPAYTRLADAIRETARRFPELVIEG